MSFLVYFRIKNIMIKTIAKKMFTLKGPANWLDDLLFDSKSGNKLKKAIERRFL